jgi:DNA-binding PadR family transcriptional regulator
LEDRCLGTVRGYPPGVSTDRPLSAGEWSVLALLCEAPSHGWALAAELAREGEIGAVWSLSRPLVYRALGILEDRNLIESPGGAASARGPRRTIYRPTAEGRAALARWLAVSVEHIREIRPDLLLKLVFSERAGVDTRALLDAQLEVVARLAEGLEEQLRQATGSRALVLRYRTETANAAYRFVESARATDGT